MARDEGGVAALPWEGTSQRDAMMWCSGMPSEQRAEQVPSGAWVGSARLQGCERGGGQAIDPSGGGRSYIWPTSSVERIRPLVGGAQLQ